MQAVKDVVVRHPHATIFAGLVSTFVVFALTKEGNGKPEDNNEKGNRRRNGQYKKKKNKKTSLPFGLMKLFSFLTSDIEFDSLSDAINADCEEEENPKGLSTILGQKTNEKTSRILHTYFSKPPPNAMSFDVDSGVERALDASFESEVEHLKQELLEERSAVLRLRDTIKREEALRMEAEEAMRMFENELVKQKRRNKKLKQEKQQIAEVRVKIFEAQMKNQAAEQRLLENKRRIAELQSDNARLREQLNAQTFQNKEPLSGVVGSDEDDTGGDGDDGTKKNRKWIFTII